MLEPFCILVWKNTTDSRERNNLLQQIFVIRDLQIMQINETKLSHFPQSSSETMQIIHTKHAFMRDMFDLGCFRSLTC